MELSVIGKHEKLRCILERIRKAHCELEIKYYDSSSEWKSIRSGIVIIPLSGAQRDLSDIISSLRHGSSTLRIILLGSEVSQAVLTYKYRCQGFICETALDEDLRYCLDNSISREILNIRTFGGFEVFKCGKAVGFGGKRAKELFALCINARGRFVTCEEAADCIWGNRPYDENVKQLFRRTVNSIAEVMRSIDAEDVFIRAKGACAVNVNNVSCDLYDFLEAPHEKAEYICGEYMTEYSWAEDTRLWIARLCPEHFSIY